MPTPKKRGAPAKPQAPSPEQSPPSTPKEAPRQTCGIVMPISALGDYSEQHWADVRQILSDAIEAAGFEPQLVSDADDVGIIQKRIIRNLYDNPVVVCDVSGKNPNVMFELGLRLAFDKPTIIVKDDATTYSFDTAPIEHLTYPRDLRFQRIVEFKEALASKITGTHQASTTDPNYTTFLKNFGTFRVAQIEETEVPANEFILEELRDIRLQMSRLMGRSGRGIKLAGDDNMVRIVAKALKDYASMNGLRTKTMMRDHRLDAMSHVERVIEAPLHFNNHSEYAAFFEAVFDLLY